MMAQTADVRAESSGALVINVSGGETVRPATFLLRVGRYAVLLLSGAAVVGVAISTLPHQDSLIRQVGRESFRDVSAFSKLLVAPLLETLIILLPWVAIARRRQAACRIAKSAYVSAITLAAWLTHGAGLGSVFPAVMFLTSASFIVRSTQRHGWSMTTTYWGAVILHVLYNLPSAMMH